MRRVIGAGVVAVGMLTVPMTAANQWTLALEKLEKSVVQIGTHCSGFVINTEKRYVLTAAHCGYADVAKPVVVDTVPSKVVAVDEHKDFLVLEVPGLDRPQLQMAENDPAIGDELASWGFGGGYEQPMLRLAHVSHNQAMVPDAGPGEWVMIDAAFVGGQSGAPVVNVKGEVVMIVQMANDRMGLGRGIEKIKDRVGKYWGKAQKP